MPAAREIQGIAVTAAFSVANTPPFSYPPHAFQNRGDCGVGMAAMPARPENRLMLFKIAVTAATPASGEVVVAIKPPHAFQNRGDCGVLQMRPDGLL